MKLNAVCWILLAIVKCAESTHNYNGQPCSPGSVKAQQKCVDGVTSFFIVDDNYVSNFNGTHLFVFVGDSVEIGCCTPPAPISVGNVSLTWTERTIAYWLNKPGETLVSVVTADKVCWDATSETDLCSLYPELNPIRNYISSDNSRCEHMTMKLRKVTTNEMGRWKCASSNDDKKKAELTVIVGDRGRWNCEATSALVRPVQITCSLLGHSPGNARIQWLIGLDRLNMERVVSSGSYLSAMIDVALLEEVRPPSCSRFATIYEKTDLDPNNIVGSSTLCYYSTQSRMTLAFKATQSSVPTIYVKVRAVVNEHEVGLSTITVFKPPYTGTNMADVGTCCLLSNMMLYLMAVFHGYELI